MEKCRPFLVGIFLLLLAGCTGITEYQDLWSWRAEVLTSPSTSGGGPAVYRVNSDSTDFGITHQVELGGSTAWDMSVHAGGDKLLVLTSQ